MRRMGIAHRFRIPGPLTDGPPGAREGRGPTAAPGGRAPSVVKGCDLSPCP
jgi:hypothetical protein